MHERDTHMYWVSILIGNSYEQLIKVDSLEMELQT